MSQTNNRAIVLDLETTGIYVHEGHRIVEVGAVELINGKPSGKEFHAYINPNRPISKDNARIHGLTNTFLATKPVFSDIAGPLRRFIGNSPVIITCRTHNKSYTLDIAHLNSALKKAGEKTVPDEQWRNVRRWSETLYGDKAAQLDNMLDRYGIDKGTRTGKTGHGALIDARLLAKLYPLLKKDYEQCRNQGPKNPPPPRP